MEKLTLVDALEELVTVYRSEKLTSIERQNVKELLYYIHYGIYSTSDALEKVKKQLIDMKL